jgi:hypothetical protein
MAYTGQIAQLSIGIDGLTGTNNPAQVNNNELVQATNITYVNGTIQKESGATKYNSSAISSGAKILGGHQWDHDGSTQREIVLTDDGTLLKDTEDAGTFGVTLKSSITIGNVPGPTFVEGGKERAAQDRKLFIFYEGMVPQVLDADGATTGDIATPPADWSGANEPTGGLIHSDRLWGFGNPNDPHRMYYSDINDHEVFTGSSAGSISVYPGEGQKIVGAVSFKGGLVVWKYPKGIYIINTIDVSVATWSIDRITGGIGMLGSKMYEVLEDDVIFMDHGGDIRLLSGVVEYGNVGTLSLSDASEMGPLIRGMDFTYSYKWSMKYNSTLRELHIAMTGTGQTENGQDLIIDFNRPDKARFRINNRDTIVSMWVRLDAKGLPELLTGDDAGFIYEMNTEARSKDGAGYEGTFQTPHFDFSHLDPKLGVTEKNFEFLEVVAEPKGSWNLSITTIIDGAQHETLQFSMGNTGVALGSFVLGTNILAGDQLTNRKRKQTGSGTRISYVATNSGDSQDFSMVRLYQYFQPGAEEGTG